MLGGGYIFLKRRNVRRMGIVFTSYALGLVVMNEVLLPSTPLKALWAQRALEGVEVRSVRDDVLLSARGNPIGIRITFQAVVPRTVEYSISASGVSRVADEVLWPLDFGHSNPPVVAPAPARGEEADFLSALSKSRKLKYRGAIQATNSYSTVSTVVNEYVTSGDYDVEAMYRTIAIEGNRRCGH